MTTQTKTTWRKVKLGELANITSSKRIYLSDYVKHGVPFFRSKEIIERHDNQRNNTELYISEEKFNSIKKMFGAPKENDLLITSVGTIGIPYLVKKDDYFYFKDGNLIWFRNFKDCDSKFIYYWIESRLGNEAINSITIGSSQSAITIIGLKNLELSIPENVIEQKKITNILSVFDDKIELNNKINQNLEQTAQAIFKEWFVKNQKSKIKNQKFGEVAKIAYGKGPTDNNLKNFGYPVYGANGIIGYSDSFNFSERQIIIGCRGVVGNVTLTLPRCIITHNSLAITPKNNRKIFFYYLLKNQNLNAVAGGSAQPQITINDLEQLELPLMDEKLQDNFEKTAELIEQKRLNIIYENQKLASLRDLLLPKLMSGEIRV